MKSILVIGMGRFGRHLAEKMMELKNDVMIIDRDANLIDELSSRFTDAQIGDCTRESVLRSIGVNNFDICFVCVGSDFQSSLQTTSLLKELGAKLVVSKSSSDIQTKFLLRNGADEVVYPERDYAEKLAIRFSAKNVFDYTELTHDYAIFEIPIMESWAGKSIAALNIREKYKINIIAIKNGSRLTPVPAPSYVFLETDHIVVVGRNTDVYRLTAKI